MTVFKYKLKHELKSEKHEMTVLLSHLTKFQLSHTFGGLAHKFSFSFS